MTDTFDLVYPKWKIMSGKLIQGPDNKLAIYLLRNALSLFQRSDSRKGGEGRNEGTREESTQNAGAGKPERGGRNLNSPLRHK